MLYIQIILSLIYIIYTLNSFKKYKLLRAVLLFYVTLYGLQLLGAIADPYHIYTIGFSTILFFNLQIVFILIGAQVAINRGYGVDKVNADTIFDFRINTPIIVIQTVFLLLIYNRYKRMSGFLLTATMSNEAREFFFNDFYSSYTEMFLNQFADAFLYISYFFAFGLIFFRKNRLGLKEFYMIISTIVIVALNTLTSFGRMGIIQLLVVFVLFFFLSKQYDKVLFKKRVIPVAAVLVSVVAVVFALTTVVRSNLGDIDALNEQTDDLVIKPFATYFYVPICAFEYGSQRIFNDIIPMLGAADLAAPIDFLLTPIRFFYHDVYSPNMVLGARMTPGFYFPSGEGWNALFTGASNYYIDFGPLGFVLFPLIHGFLFVYLIYKARNKASWYIVFLFFFVASFIHLVSSGIQSMSVVFVIIWIIILRKMRIVL